MMEGPWCRFRKEKHEPVSDIDTAVVVDGLKALDPKWPIREADIGMRWSRKARSRMTRSRLQPQHANKLGSSIAVRSVLSSSEAFVTC